MKPLNLFAFLPLITGFFPPEGTPDGAYLISRNQDGGQNITKIDVPAPSPTIEARRPSGRLTKRNSHGGTGRTFPDHVDYNFLTNTWRTYLQGGGSVPGLQVLVMGRGQARLAECNYRNYATGGYPQTVDQFNGLMDSNVGFWKTGWLHSDAYNWSFWRDLVGTSFCTNLTPVPPGGGGSPFDPVR